MSDDLELPTRLHERAEWYDDPDHREGPHSAARTANLLRLAGSTITEQAAEIARLRGEVERLDRERGDATEWACTASADLRATVLAWIDAGLSLDEIRGRLKG